MGCCLSCTTIGSHHHPPQKQEPKRSNPAIPPPSASLEEETVKEVLSETPIIPKPPQNSPSTHQKITQIPIAQEPKSQEQLLTKVVDEEVDRERTPEISQASEIYSIADTYSAATTATTTTTTTTTVTEIRDDEVTSKKRANRSPAKLPRKRPYTGDRDRVPKPPARRERPAVKREFSGQARTAKQSNVGSSRVGKDLGERSRRRSRSPADGAVKGRGGGRPAKLIGKSGNKPAEVAVGSGVVKKEEESTDDSVLMQRTGNESLDNPHVSLECFIFL